MPQKQHSRNHSQRSHAKAERRRTTLQNGDRNPGPLKISPTRSSPGQTPYDLLLHPEVRRSMGTQL